MNPARGTLYKLGLLALALALLAGAAGMQHALNRQRADPALGLMRVADLGSNAPPMLAFTTVALGGFRGLIANALWIRANDLQLEGKYFEMVQLADWITKLEPTFTQVWVVQAWNMTYNISVQFSDYPDRWRWVQRGIELLRDEGLRYNPTDAQMYRELGWFYQHKMGQIFDDAHTYYKAAWAKEMTAALGSGRPDFAELLNPRTDAARQRLQILRDKYKLEPQLMKEVDDRYGPLDWRLPEAHAIYWATAGLKRSKKKDLIILRRIIYQSMHMTALRGRIVYIEPDGRLITAPDLDKAPLVNATYEQLIADDAEMRHAIQTAHKNFLKEIIYLLYVHNRLADANRWLAVIREKYPDAIAPNLSLDDYALEKIKQNMGEMSNDRVRAMLHGLLYQHFLSLALDEDDRADGFDRMAGQLWQTYDQSIEHRKDPLRLPPVKELKQFLLEEILNPQRGLLTPELIARLQTRLGLPARPAPPPATPEPKR